MYNPAHSGEVLKELMSYSEVTALAARLSVDRTTLSRLLNGRAGISAPWPSNSKPPSTPPPKCG